MPGIQESLQPAEAALAHIAWLRGQTRAQQCLDVPALPAAAASVRERVDDVCPRALGDLRFEARLCATEIVTNAVLHGAPGDPAAVHVELGWQDGVGFWCAVTNDARGPAAAAPEERIGGLGLPIVMALASRWGVFAEHGTTTFWFELAVDA